MTDTYLDGLLDELVTAEPRERWNDVLSRVRRTRRRYAALIAAVAVLVLAPATWAAVDAFEGTPAPPSVQLTFNRFEAQAAAREYALAKAGFIAKAPRAEASEARGVLQVQTGDGPLDLWAAPMTGGGVCSFIGWESDLNLPDGAGGVGTCYPPTSSDADNLSWGTASDNPAHPTYSAISGYARGDAKTVDLTLGDGQTTTVPVVEHFFLTALNNGATVTSLVARNANGDVVGSWKPGS